jgi:Double-stranded RNA binding motif
MSNLNLMRPHPQLLFFILFSFTADVFEVRSNFDHIGHSITDSSVERQSYVAGVYVTQGLEVVQRWLSALFRPYVTHAYRIIRAEYGFPPESISPTPEGDDTSPTPPLVQSRMPPLSYCLPPTGMTTGHLSLFNQYLQQKGKFVEWDWTDSDVTNGKATPVWAVCAMIDQRCVGKGRATTKKAAKNEAATQALKSLGIYVSPQICFGWLLDSCRSTRYKSGANASRNVSAGLGVGFVKN